MINFKNTLSTNVGMDKIKITDLRPVEDVVGLTMMGVDQNGESVKFTAEKLSGELSHQQPSDWESTQGVARILNKPLIAQNTGSSTKNLMSQKAVTDAINSISVADASEKILQHNTLNSAHADIRKAIDAVNSKSILVILDGLEHVIGKFVYGGKQYDLFDKSVSVSGITIAENESLPIVISDQPLGGDLFLTVTSVTVKKSIGFDTTSVIIKDLLVDSSGNTVASVFAPSGVTNADLFLTVRYVKGLVSYKCIDISVPLSSVADVDGLEVYMPTCKYDLDFALSITGDDSLLGLYQKAFNYIHGRYIDDANVWHQGQDKTSGLTPDRKLYYTDGCGNDIPFALSSNWMRGNEGSNIHQNGNQYLNNMWWSELEHLLDFDGGILNHGGGDQTKPLESINKNQEDIRANSTIEPFIMGIPGGTSGYPEEADGLETMYMLTSSGFANKNISLSSINEAFKLRYGRVCLDNLTLDEIKNKITPFSSGHKWTTLFMHNIRNSSTRVNGQLNADTCYALLDWLHDTYGSGGNGSVWVASEAEVYEYLFAQKNFSYTKLIDGDQLILKCKFAVLPLFYRYEWSVMLSQVIGTDTKILTDGFGLDYNSIGLINIKNLSRRTALADKYTSIFELSPTEENKNEALILINLLHQNLRADYLDRLDIVTPSTYCTVTAVSNNVNQGLVTPPSQQVTTGQTATIQASASNGCVISGWSNTSRNNGIGDAIGTAYVDNVINDVNVICHFSDITIPGNTKMIIIPAISGAEAGKMVLQDGTVITKVFTQNSSITSSYPIYNISGEMVAKRVSLASLLPEGIINLQLITASYPVLSGDTGAYPDACLSKLSSIYDAKPYPTAKSLLRIADLDPGNYKVKILMSTSIILSQDAINGMIYTANGVQAIIPTLFNPTNNNSVFINIDNSIVAADGLLDIYIGNNSPYTRTGFNLLEIEKITN